MSLDIALWNMENGFVEGLIRGLRSTFLTDTEYANLKEGGKRAPGGAGGGSQKEDFEDMRLSLQETDYGTFLAAEPSLDPKLIGLRATAKWVREMRYVRSTATGDLAKFLDFVSYEYMIDNILDLIKAATSSQTVDAQAVVAGCHPLGLLEESVMKSVLAFEDLGEDFHALYRTVLVDTPVGKYFTQFLREVAEESAASDIEHVRATFAEIPMPLIENSVKKYYLEDFYAFCEGVGGETAAVMCALLSARADITSVNITVNSLHTDLSRANIRTTRASLFPSIGRLYPEGVARLAAAEDEDTIGRVLQDCAPDYAAMWNAAPADARGNKDVSQAFFARTVGDLEDAFEGQFHFGAFYAYAKLKEQEVKNIAWIATCLEHGAYSEVDRILPIFSKGRKA